MAHFLHGRPLLLLFGVAAVGYLLGKIRVRGFSLGVAAVLFVGLFVGAAVPGVELPDFVAQLGLVLFVYTVGLASGPGFVASLRLRGLRDSGLALGTLLGAFGLTLALGRALGLPGPTLAGLFAGALTNTPALAAVTESLKSAGAPAATLAAPVLAYSLTYPLGVLFPLVGLMWAGRRLRASHQPEPIPRDYGTGAATEIVNVTAHVDRAPSATAHELRHAQSSPVVFGRLRREAVTSTVADDVRFCVGDLVTIVGAPRDVLATAAALGHVSSEHIDLDRSEIGVRRMFVSNRRVASRPLGALRLNERYGATITRVRRGDVDLSPDEGFELMLGDRARVVAPRDQLPELARLLGDSARRIAEVDVITFGLGIALGLLLGAATVPLRGGASFSLGLAAGPLVAGVLLGWIGRTGPLVWSLPYGANMTLRQLGVVLFLAGVGIKAGATLNGSISQGAALRTALAGAGVTALSVSAVVYVGRCALRIPLAVLVGTLAGIQTQPAALAFAVEKTENDLPNVGYAMVFPVAMIAKVVLAQLLLAHAGR
jgi:putative transport protein